MKIKHQYSTTGTNDGIGNLLIRRLGWRLLQRTISKSGQCVLQIFNNSKAT